jgi:hypothetical protein
MGAWNVPGTFQKQLPYVPQAPSDWQTLAVVAVHDELQLVSVVRAHAPPTPLSSWVFNTRIVVVLRLSLPKSIFFMERHV